MMVGQPEQDRDHHEDRKADGVQQILSQHLPASLLTKVSYEELYAPRRRPTTRPMFQLIPAAGVPASGPQRHAHGEATLDGTRTTGDKPPAGEG
jgi:hypothetical protein